MDMYEQISTSVPPAARLCLDVIAAPYITNSLCQSILSFLKCLHCCLSLTSAIPLVDVIAESRVLGGRLA